MTELYLSIITPEGTRFAGTAERVLVRTAWGDVCILPGHADYTALLGAGRASVAAEGTVKYAEVHGGVISVIAGRVHILTNHFDWQHENGT